METTKARELAINLIQKHKLDIEGWTFKYTNAKTVFGKCSYKSKTISLSKPLTIVNKKDDVVNTILHEIAHALCPKQNHNNIWKSKAKEIGCDGSRCYCTDKIKQPKSKYVAICVGCKKVYKAYRLRKRKSSCGFCSGGKFNPLYKLQYSTPPLK